MRRTLGSSGRRSGPETVRMETPEDVAAMLRLSQAGWGAKTIARELGCSKNTVKRYLSLGGWQPYAGGQRRTALGDHEAWVQDAFVRHGGNAAVVQQELVREKAVKVSLRTVERAVAGQRRGLRARAVATMRFETPPGRQLQADFGQLQVTIAEVPQKVHFCVLTLGWSRRMVVRCFPREQQANWLLAMEEAFRTFGGVPAEVLVDNARALVTTHNVQTGEIVFSDRFARFAQYWGFRPRACAPYRPQTKGKDERGVGYVKRSCLAGRSFPSWEALEAWLVEWTRKFADERVHGTTGERPRARFDREEAAAMRPLPDRPPFQAERELERVVHNDACVEVDANWYSVPWRLAKTTVLVRVRDQVVTVHHGGQEVARHARLLGRRERSVNEAHWEGLTRPAPAAPPPDEPPPPPPPEFLRSLEEYAAVANEVAA